MGLAIKVSDLVKHCFNGDDGQKIYDVIYPELKQGNIVDLSFEKIDTVTSSFVNVALITLLDDLSFDEIKKLLKFTNTNSQINEMIKSRFVFEVQRIKDQHLQVKKNDLSSNLAIC